VLSRVGTSQLLVGATLLAGAGLVMVYSASAMRANLIFGSADVYLWRQLGGLAIGAGAAFTLSRMPQNWIKQSGYAAWAVAVLLLAATLSPLGVSQNGAQRWLALGPLQFQPLEVMKLALILAIAQWLASRGQRVSDVRVSVLAPLAFAGLPALLLLQQPDYGGALLLFAFAGVLMFAGGARLDHLLVSAVVSLPVLSLLAVSRGYRLERIQAFFDPWADPFGRGYQLVQSLLAFGAGGISGSGLGAGQQKLGYLPEAHTDFILSVVAEEMGLIGVSALLACLAVIALASLGIASRARDRFSALLATGASALFWLQGLVNSGVAMGVLPTTGATLPLFSYGRTSLVVSLAAVGLLLNVARPARRGRSGWRS